MKKFLVMMLAVTLVAGAWVSPANAALVTLDIFDGGEGDPGDLNINIPARQAGSPVESTYTWGGAGTPGAAVIVAGAPFGSVMLNTLTNPVGGDHVVVDMDTDYGTALGGKEWTISYFELVQADADWGGWAGLFVGETRGFGASFGMILRPDGAYSIFNGGTEIASDVAGSLAGEDAVYNMSVSFDEVNNTVTVAQNGADVGTWATTLSGTSRFIQFRTHFDGGSEVTAVDILRDNVLIEAIPEPSTAALLCLAGLGVILRRRK